MWRKKPVSWWLPLFSFYLLHNKHQTAYTLKIIKCCMHNVRMSNIIINIAVVRFARAKRFSPPLFYSCSFFECLWVRFLSFIFSLSLSCIFAMALSCSVSYAALFGVLTRPCRARRWRLCDKAIERTLHMHIAQNITLMFHAKREEEKKNPKILIIICIVWLIRLVVW